MNKIKFSDVRYPKVTFQDVSNKKVIGQFHGQKKLIEVEEKTKVLSAGNVVLTWDGHHSPSFDGIYEVHSNNVWCIYHYKNGDQSLSCVVSNVKELVNQRLKNYYVFKDDEDIFYAYSTQEPRVITLGTQHDECSLFFDGNIARYFTKDGIQEIQEIADFDCDYLDFAVGNIGNSDSKTYEFIVYYKDEKNCICLKRNYNYFVSAYEKIWTYSWRFNNNYFISCEDKMMKVSGFQNFVNENFVLVPVMTIREEYKLLANKECRLYYEGTLIATGVLNKHSSSFIELGTTRYSLNGCLLRTASVKKRKTFKQWFLSLFGK